MVIGVAVVVGQVESAPIRPAPARLQRSWTRPRLVRLVDVGKMLRLVAYVGYRKQRPPHAALHAQVPRLQKSRPVVRAVREDLCGGRRGTLGRIEPVELLEIGL